MLDVIKSVSRSKISHLAKDGYSKIATRNLLPNCPSDLEIQVFLFMPSNKAKINRKQFRLSKEASAVQ